MFNKIKLPHVIYSAVAIITVGLILSLTIWAATGATMEQLNVIEGEVLLEENVRNEYLVGQDVDSTGVTLKVGKDVYATDELQFTVDNQSAGSKMVEVSHRDGNNYYRGYFLVTYFAVRHLEMHKAPTGVSMDADGNVTVQGMELWAELSGKPTSFVQPDEPGLETVIILDADNYVLEVDAQDENGGYPVKISCGNHSVNIYFVEVYGEMVVVENFNRIAFFTNEKGTGESLALCISSRGGSENGKINVADGFFVYRDASGVVHKYQFDYYMSSADWSSHFQSNDSAVSLTFWGDALMVNINGVTFSTPRSSWCLAILDNPNP